MVDDLDRELWRRGHRFVRYADDVHVFVRSKRAALRVFAPVATGVEQRSEPKEVPASVATLLGFGFYFTRLGAHPGRPEDAQALEGVDPGIDLAPVVGGDGLSQRLVEPVRRRVDGLLPACGRPGEFQSLDEWLRRRKRQLRWKEWKRPRSLDRMLRLPGVPGRSGWERANSSKGYWRIGGSAVLKRALPNAY